MVVFVFHSVACASMTFVVLECERTKFMPRSSMILNETKLVTVDTKEGGLQWMLHSLIILLSVLDTGSGRQDCTWGFL